MKSIFFLLSIVLLLSLVIPQDSIVKGLTMSYYYPEDLTRSGAQWFYTWGACPENAPVECVPMSYSGGNPNLPADYGGYILLFNEPNNVPPYGGTLTPEEGAARYLALHPLYPNAKWIVGNVSAWALDWLTGFRTACGVGCPPVDAWGIHGYVEAWITVQHLKNWWTAAHTEMGGDFWITEWADTNGDVYNDRLIRNWIESQPWITRWAYYTNRASGSEPWYPSYWGNTQLFDWETGEPTIIGFWYMGQLNQINLPLIENNVAYP